MTLSRRPPVSQGRDTIPRLLQRHAEDAAFYWARRNDGARDSRHSLHTLARMEFLLSANLEGLRVAERHSAVAPAESGAAGWKGNQWGQTRLKMPQ